MCKPATFPSAALVGLAIALACGEASAAATCSAGALSLSLGTYTGDTSAPLDSIGAMTVTCTRSGGNASFPVTLGIGPSASSGSISNRTMKWASGTDQLAYNLYVDGGRFSVWGQTVGVDTVSQGITVPNKGTASVTFTIYARIPGLQNVPPGGYSDSLLVTLTY